MCKANSPNNLLSKHARNVDPESTTTEFHGEPSEGEWIVGPLSVTTTSSPAIASAASLWLDPHHRLLFPNSGFSYVSDCHGKVLSASYAFSSILTFDLIFTAQ